MRWSDLRPSTNVEDRRGIGGGRIAIGGGGIGILILAALIYLCGGDPRQLLQNLPSQTEVQQPGSTNPNNRNDESMRFARAVLGSTEDAWGQILPQQARIRYSPPTLVVFTDQISSACGYTTS